MDVEEIARIAVDCGFKLHQRLGLGLLESVYEVILFESLARRGLAVERQVPIDIHYDDFVIKAGFRADLLVAGKLLIELKSVEMNAPVHKKQLLTYMRLMNHSLGLLMNFGTATFQEGCHRIVNKHTDFASSRLRVSKNDIDATNAVAGANQ
jgi:iron complex transport system substrate-binding protein